MEIEVKYFQLKLYTSENGNPLQVEGILSEGYEITDYQEDEHGIFTTMMSLEPIWNEEAEALKLLNKYTVIKEIDLVRRVSHESV